MKKLLINMNLNNLLGVSAFLPRLLQSPSAWLGHLPFAAWVIQEVSPKIFVELGSHYGHSYFAFCQAVQESGLSSKCFAVDTWEGDQQAGQYHEDVFDQVHAQNKEQYKDFSYLLRMTFDEAVSSFADKSIELIHIDGLHTYEAVRHDFETWLPKLSPGAVVLFHDTNVRECNFGVWKFWEELQEQYPSNFEFVHSYGLGVLQLNDAPDAKRIEWLQPNASEKEQLKRYFASLGSRQMDRYEFNGLKIHANNLNNILTERNGQIENLNQVAAERYEQIESLNGQIESLNGQIESLNGQLADLTNSKSFRITAPFRSASRQLKKFLRIIKLSQFAIKHRGGLNNNLKKVIRIYRQEGVAGIKRSFRLIEESDHLLTAPNSGIYARNDYTEWVRRYDTLNDEIRAAMFDRIDHFQDSPLISIVMPTYNSNPAWLKEAIEAVRKQLYPHWELCIADDASTDKEIRSILERYSEEDSRIKVVFRKKNGHISAASNSALEQASGDWVALLDHDDILSEHALYWVANAIHLNPDSCLIYSDEDKIDEQGSRFAPYFKCDWNRELFYSHNMISHLGVYRTSLLRDIDGFREGLEGSQDYDLALRYIERIESKQIHHIPRVLYHWRVHAESTAHSGDAKPYALLAGEKALNEHFQRQAIDARSELLDFGMYRVHYALPNTKPMVTLIIPTRNRLTLTRQCIESIVKKTTYPNYEILIVDNGSDDPEILQYFEELQVEERVRVLRDDSPFNFSALNNAAAKLARGEILGLLNNDLEVISPGWLSEMVSHAIRPNIGAVGAKLWYPNDTLQHGGVLLGIGGVASHAHLNMVHGMHGYFGRASLIQEMSAVTAACLVIRKSIFEQVGGLNETDLKVAFNDVDFCLRVREAGYRNVWTPFAELYHHESATRGYEDSPEKKARFAKEVHFMMQKWSNLLLNDPAYNPNLTLNYSDLSLAWPPRVESL